MGRPLPLASETFEGLAEGPVAAEAGEALELALLWEAIMKGARYASSAILCCSTCSGFDSPVNILASTEE